MRNYIYILLLLLLAGCSSVIKVPESSLTYSYKMLGADGSRNFFHDGNISDSLKFCWSAETHGGFSNTSVTVRNNAVFIGDLSGRVFCFDFQTGKEIGELKSKGAINSAVLVNEFRLVYSIEYPNLPNSSLFFYDFKNGDELKNVKLKGRISSELILDDDRVFAVTKEGWCYVLNIKGEIQWSLNLSCKILSSPVLFGNMVCVISAEGKLFVLDFYTGKTASTMQLIGNFEGGMIVKGNILFCSNNSGVVYAVDLKNDKVMWTFNTGYRIKNYPAADNKAVYISNLKGEIFALDINSGSQNWKTVTEGLFDTAPLVTGNYIIVPDQNKKYLFISKDSGKIIKTLQVEGRVKLSPVIIDNFLFVGYEKGKIVKYEFIK